MESKVNNSDRRVELPGPLTGSPREITRGRHRLHHPFQVNCPWADAYAPQGAARRHDDPRATLLSISYIAAYSDSHRRPVRLGLDNIRAFQRKWTIAYRGVGARQSWHGWASYRRQGTTLHTVDLMEQVWGNLQPRGLLVGLHLSLRPHSWLPVSSGTEAAIECRRRRAPSPMAGRRTSRDEGSLDDLPGPGLRRIVALTRRKAVCRPTGQMRLVVDKVSGHRGRQRERRAGQRCIAGYQRGAS